MRFATNAKFTYCLLNSVNDVFYAIVKPGLSTHWTFVHLLVLSSSNFDVVVAKGTRENVLAKNFIRQSLETGIDKLLQSEVGNVQCGVHLKTGSAYSGPSEDKTISVQ